jgi:uncharacterized protein (TIGR03083 family)
VFAGDLAWDCRRTLDHIADALFFYAASLATRAAGSPLRGGGIRSAASPAQLLAMVEAAAAILADVIRAAPPGTRAYHPAGMADATGWLGMACEEILLHTDDIARGFGLPFRPPDDLCLRIAARIFPWTPIDADPWAALRWAAAPPSRTGTASVPIGGGTARRSPNGTGRSGSGRRRRRGDKEGSRTRYPTNSGVR